MTHWVVVGGGTAGCVIAGRLSEDPASHVTLVEAGGPAEPLSASYLDDHSRPGALWERLLVTDGDGVPRPYPQGRGIGGSSAVSGGVLSGGGRSSLPAEQPGGDELGSVDRALLAAAPDADVVTLSRRAGARLSAADVYLAPALGRSNLDVLTGAEVERVALMADRATGVVLADGTVVAADAVVCCGGAIFTPAVLLRSGISVSGLGEGLRDHVGKVVEVAVEADVGGLVTGAVLSRDPIEIVTMNHLGRDAAGRGALLVGLLRNRRRGSVRIDGSGWPVVQLGRLGDVDRALLDGGVRLALELAESAGFAAVEVVDGFGGYAHATSSCAASVDGSGAIRGFSRLYACDASTLPELPASGTLLPVVAHAERFVARLPRP